MEKNRLEAFSDGVLAIIITIMVLEFKIPHGHQWSDLLPLFPVFISYILSFLYVGIYWGNHHHLMQTIKKVNSKIMLANLNLLFWLSLIPFVTGWMGENHFESNTVALYSLILLMCGVSYFVLQKTIESSFVEDTNFKNAMRKHSNKGILSVVCYIVAMPLAYYSLYLAEFILFGVALIWLIPDKNIEKAIKE